MSTHYEVLGVPTDASSEAVRQAYVRIAKVNHPDRRSSDDPRRRAQADAVMKEANQAWYVLRDPQRRYRYDLTLAEPNGPTRSARVATSHSTGVGGERAASGVVVPAAHASYYRWVPVVLIVLVLGGILVFSAYATSQDGVTPTGPTTTEPEYPVGSCVLVAALDTGPQPVRVACGTGNSAVVDSTVATPRPCPPDTIALPLDDNRTTLCLKSAR